MIKNNNVNIIDTKSVFIGKDVKIGKNVTIYEINRIDGTSEIKDGVTLFPGNFIKNTVIGENSTLNNSDTEDAIIGNNCKIGPFARLRPGTVLKNNVHIGNFVEIKNSVIGEGTKACHLAYVGDADIGKNVNIGCGAIFVNYNGRTKSRSKVGDNSFIGSNANVIAPVEIEDNSYVCAGTTVTEKVNSDDFVIGRVRQEVKKNRAHDYLKNLDKNNKK